MYRRAWRCWLCFCEAYGINLHRHGNLIRQTLERINHDSPEGEGTGSFQHKLYANYGEIVSQREQGRRSFNQLRPDLKAAVKAAKKKALSD